MKGVPGPFGKSGVTTNSVLKDEVIKRLNG
jgi:hypothetical protein